MKNTQNFKINNTFSITSKRDKKNQKILVKNRIIDHITPLKNNLAYAKYMIFYALSGEKIVKETQVLHYNSDVSIGGLYAQYGAGLNGEEGGGLSFYRISLSFDGENQFNEAEFTPIIKDGNESIYVEATVNLSISGGESYMFGGDNPLAEFLLGMNSLHEDCTVCKSGCNILGGGFSYGYDKENPSKASVAVEANGDIIFSGEAPLNANEAIFQIGTRAALRLNIPENNPQIRILQDVFSAERTIETQYDLSQIVNLSIGAQNYGAASLHYAYDKMIEIDNAAKYNVGRGSTVKSGLFNDYAAVIGRKEIRVYSFNGKKLKEECLIYKEEREAADIFYGGKTAVLGESLKIYNASGVLTEEFAVPYAENFRISDDGAAYHVITTDQNNIARRYLLSSSAATLLAEYSFSSQPKLFRRLNFLGVAGKEDVYFGTATASLFAVENNIKAAFSANAGFTDFKFCGGIMYIEAGGVKKLISVSNLSEIILPQNAEVTVAESAVFVKADGIVKTYYYHPLNKTAHVLKEEKSGFSPLGAAQVNGFMLCVDSNGGVKAYYLNRNGSYIYTPSVLPQGTANVTVRERKTNDSEYQTARIKFTISAVS